MTDDRLARDHHGVVLVDKPRGLSPVQSITRLKALDPSLAARRIGYAGRLDPLASGLLVLLVDEANRRAHEFNALDKRYELDVLFGVRTDSFDLLGLPVLGSRALDEQALDAALESLRGTRMQPYPRFSSVRIDGHPGFYWARRGEDPPSGWPSRARTIRHARVLARSMMDGGALVEQARRDIRSVIGDFRQRELDAAWGSLAPSLSGRLLAVVRLEIVCSSGTFMRSIADELGGAAGCGALASAIRRTQVGPYSLEQARAL
jgi:tRNA pseudouridine55 synthase